MKQIDRRWFSVIALPCLLISGCASVITKDQIIELPSLVQAIKESILIAEDCVRLTKTPHMFALGPVKLTFQAVATQSGDVKAPIVLGVIPIDLRASVSTQQTQTISIDLTPLQVSPHEALVTTKTSKNGDKYKIVDLVQIGPHVYVWGINEEGKEIWYNATEMTKIEAVTRRGSGLTEEELRKRCAPKRTEQ